MPTLAQQPRIQPELQAAIRLGTLFQVTGNEFIFPQNDQEPSLNLHPSSPHTVAGRLPGVCQLVLLIFFRRREAPRGQVAGGQVSGVCENWVGHSGDGGARPCRRTRQSVTVAVFRSSG